MARQPRPDHPGSIHHVTARGIGRRVLFVDDSDRDEFLALLGRVAGDMDWTCHSYCLMGNHYHLVVGVGEQGLSRGMYRLNSLFAQRYNRIYDVRGHVLDKRFSSQLVDRDDYLLELVRYVHLNPVRAGLCRTPERWRWSSYRAIAGFVAAPAFLRTAETLRLFGRDPGDARSAFSEFVADGMECPQRARAAENERPDMRHLLRTLGLEGARLAVETHGYLRRDVAAAMGVHPRTLNRQLAAWATLGRPRT